MSRQVVKQCCGILALFLIAAFSGCRSVPITDRTQLMLTTSGYENSLGVEAYSEYKEKYPRSTNSEYNQALDRCGMVDKTVE